MENITDEEYLNAVRIIRLYHSQVNREIKEIPNTQYTKVKCVSDSAGGHFLYFLTVGKEYKIMRNPYKKGWRAASNNIEYFAIKDDNGIRRNYEFKNPSRIWEFVI